MRSIALASGEFFHVYNRGTDKRTIFLDTADHYRFLELLYLCNSTKQINVRDVKKTHESVFDFERDETLVAIGAYCLMPNHFHVLLTATVEGGISKFMTKLSTGYSMYFNRRYNRTGALFQGKFRAEHADSDEYLRYIYSYIHLNPVKLIDRTWRERGVADEQAAFSFVSSFEYSSLPDYLGGNRPQGATLSPAAFPDYFSTPREHQAELFEWLTCNRPVSDE